VVSFFEQQFAVRQAEDDAMRMEVADAVADAVTIKFGHFIKFIVRSKLGDSVEIEVPDHESILHVKALVQQQRPEFKQTKQKLIFTVDNQTRVLENDKSVASCGITLNSIVDLVLVDHSDILRTIGSFGGDVSQFNFPNGVVATEDCIYIADTANHRIQVLNRSDCTFARTLQSDTVKMPLAVYVAQSEVLVTCKNDRRIHVFDCSGSYLRCIEYTGEPRGLCVHNEQLFVADSGKKCISVLQLNGTVVRTIGTPGTATGKLLSPSSVVILQNELFVCDTNNHRVQVFDLDGSFVRAIGSEGAGSNQFSYPTDIAVSSTHLIVCDTGNKRVQLLDHQGSFLQTLGSDGKCTAPCNVAHFNDQIYVIDRPKNQLCVFEL
jgi:WD40 repeat protein